VDEQWRNDLLLNRGGTSGQTMHDRHTDRERYFNEQALTSRKYVVPFIQEVMPVGARTAVLEVGCGEGGNLLPFVEMGCQRVVGIDLSAGKIGNAKRYFAAKEGRERVTFIADDIYNVTPEQIGQFDVIITRDVLEHIHGQERFMQVMRKFLKPGGRFFLGFPPWHNPFGGHQQMCESKWLSKVPYFHILPGPVYRSILKAFGETDEKIVVLQEIKDTGITIERFQRILKKEQYRIDKRTFYFINPNYEVKFGLKPREAWRWVSALPGLRNFLITTNYYLISRAGTTS
jgi:SAM-dependent methyltransferase